MCVAFYVFPRAMNTRAETLLYRPSYPVSVLSCRAILMLFQIDPIASHVRKEPTFEHPSTQIFKRCPIVIMSSINVVTDNNPELDILFGKGRL